MTSSKDVKAELLPCPFCGARDGRLVQAFTQATDTFAYWSVECLDCACEIASDESQTEADAAWNTRHRSSDTALREARLGDSAVEIEDDFFESAFIAVGSNVYFGQAGKGDGLLVLTRSGAEKLARTLLAALTESTANG